MRNRISTWIDTHAVDFTDLPQDLRESPDEDLNCYEYVDKEIGLLEKVQDKVETAELKEAIRSYQDTWIKSADSWFEYEYKFADDLDAAPELRLVHHFVREMLETDNDTFELSEAEMRKVCEKYGFDYRSLSHTAPNETEETDCDTHQIVIKLEKPISVFKKNFWKIEVFEWAEADAE